MINVKLLVGVVEVVHLVTLEEHAAADHRADLGNGNEVGLVDHGLGDNFQLRLEQLVEPEDGPLVALRQDNEVRVVRLVLDDILVH